MKKMILTFVGFFALNLLSLAQNPVGILAPKYVSYGNQNQPEINSLPGPIPNSPPNPNKYNGLPAKSSQNIQMDASGQEILFFTIDEKVYDRKGRLIGLLMAGTQQTGYGAVNPSGELLIVPASTCGNEFYIFGTFERSTSGLKSESDGFYDKIKVVYDANDDLIDNSGLLSFEELQVNGTTEVLNMMTLIGAPYEQTGGTITQYVNSRTLYAAAKMNSQGTRFVYVHSGPKIHRLKIQNGNLTYDNYTLDLSIFGSVLHDTPLMRQELEIITLPNGNLRMAVPIRFDINNTNKTGYFTLDFNATTGNYITGSKKEILYPHLPSNLLITKGVELSQNGRYLFLTHHKITDYQSTIDVFDLDAANPFASRQVISTSDDYKDSQLEIKKTIVNNVVTYSILVPAQNRMDRIVNGNIGGASVFENSYHSLTNYNAVSPLTQNNVPVNRNARLLQDQIDDEDYTQFGQIFYSVDNITISDNNTLWVPGSASNLTPNANLLVLDKIVVPAGKTLTIQNMNIYFAENARIIVENSTGSLKGGRLVVRSSKLTADIQCGTAKMWRGIEVHGNPNLAQGSIASTKQGSVLITDNSVVEHAYIGIAARKYNKNVNAVSQNVFFSVALNFEGGIIQTSSSTFRNNQTDIELNSYSAPNLANNVSSFQNTTFKTDGLLNKPTLNLHPHIKLHRVRGVRITGCDFINVTPHLYAFNQQGIGIRAYESSFSVLKGCTNPLFINCTPTDPNRFENLYIGVNATGGIAITNSSFTVDGSIFNKNQLGIYALNTQRHRVTNNSFVVNRLDPVNPSNITQTAGLYMKGSTGYTVEGNIFSTDINDPLSLEDSNPYGIVVNNSGEYSNLIYRNQFNNLRIGGQSERINSTLSTSTNSNTIGLQWKCNVFKETAKHDLSVVNGRIDNQQGTDYSSISLPVTVLTKRRDAANNEFSAVNEDPTLFHDIVMSNSDHNMRYTHLADASHIPNSATPDVPFNGVLNIQQTANNVPVYAASDGCPTLIRQIGGFTLIEWQIKLATLRTIEEDLANLGSQHPDYAAVYAEYIYLKRIADLELDEIIYTFLNDTVLGNTNDLLDFIESNNRNDLALQKLALELHLSLNNFNEASTILGENDFDADYIAFITAMIAMNGENPCDYLDSNAVVKEDLRVLMLSTENEEVKSRIEAILNYCDENEISYEFLPIIGSRSDMFRPETATTIQETTQFSLYPNPASESVRLVSKSDEKANYSLRVMNVVGQVVHEDEMNRNEKFINVSAFENGMYIIQIQDGAGSVIESIKFLKN